MKKHEPHIAISSLYGAAANMPLVELELVGYPRPRIQMTVDQARSIALQLLEACEAAQSDALVFRFATQVIDLDAHAATMLLRQFRQMREDLGRPADTPPQGSVA